ncbi:putative acyl-CoA oxidase domain protein [Mycobacterium xenopi 3993]|nr:putative acyl-CoA oxidase domain protein [Mycobacterium xenopi 3993]
MARRKKPDAGPLADEIFRPHYTPNTVIARTKVAEQMKIMAAAGAAESAFRKEHGGTGDLGAAITAIEMLAMSDLSLMVKAGCSGVCSAGRGKPGHRTPPPGVCEEDHQPGAPRFVSR